MKEYPIIDYLDLIRTEQNNIDVSDLDIAYLYNQLTSSLSIPKKYFEQKLLKTNFLVNL
jgi:hypothetical protein